MPTAHNALAQRADARLWRVFSQRFTRLRSKDTVGVSARETKKRKGAIPTCYGGKRRQTEKTSRIISSIVIFSSSHDARPRQKKGVACLSRSWLLPLHAPRSLLPTAAVSLATFLVNNSEGRKCKSFVELPFSELRYETSEKNPKEKPFSSLSTLNSS